MDTFRWMSVAFSLMLGMGMARLLTCFIALFHSRRHATLDWLPMLWGGLILLTQMQFWWAIIELASFEVTWNLWHFMDLLALTLLLYLAAATVLPPSGLQPGEDMRDAFQKDGRWALVACSAYTGMVLHTNWWLFDVAPLSEDGRFNLPGLVLPLMAFLARTRSGRVMATLAHTGIALYTFWLLSPSTH
jgi:hypothetical protein